jgi:hypothetical protein
LKKGHDSLFMTCVIFVLLTFNFFADRNQVRSFQASCLFCLWISVVRTFQCCFSVFLFALGMESRALCLLDKHSTMWEDPQPLMLLWICCPLW